MMKSIYSSRIASSTTSSTATTTSTTSVPMNTPSSSSAIITTQSSTTRNVANNNRIAHHHHRIGHNGCTTSTGSGGGGGGIRAKCQQVKCVFVGDGAIGKTSLIVSYTTNGYPAEYVPTAFDTYSVVVTIDNKPCQLQLCDTAGQDDFDSIRPLCYKHTDVFMVCFSVVSPGSFASIRQKWLPEIRRSLQQSSKSDASIPPFILVGTQCDLRHDVKVLIELDAAGQQPISSDYARAMAKKFGAISYIECSALTQKNLKEVFDTAILAALDYRNQVKLVAHNKPSASSPINNGAQLLVTSPIGSRSPNLSSKSATSKSPTGQHPKHAKAVDQSSNGTNSGSPPPLPLSPHPQRHHFVPLDRTKNAKISDARLVGWRKSLTKLSAQEALESEAAAAASTSADDYDFYSSNTSSMASMALTSSGPIASTSSASSSNSSSTSPKYRTIVRSKRSDWNNTTATSALINNIDQDDDQGFHDEEEDDEDDAEEEDGAEDEEDEPISFDDQTCLNMNKSNCHYYYHRSPPNQSAGQSSHAQIISNYSAGSGRVYNASTATAHTPYYYYRPQPPPPVPSPPYNDPYRSDYYSHNYPQQQLQSSGLATRLLPPQPQATIMPSRPQPQTKLQSFFNFSRPTSTTSNNQHQKGGVGGCVGGSIFSGHQTNLNTTLRSSSFFFLPSGNYKKNVPEKKVKPKKSVSKSCSTSSSTNTCTTTSSSSSSASSTSSTMSNSLFKPTSGNNNNHYNHSTGLGSAFYRSEIFQIMSNSVTELRARKSILKKFTLSSSGSSSRSSSRRSSSNSVTEKSKLKAKKLKELYYYGDDDDYEEIDVDEGKKGFFSCCFPFGRR